VSRNYVVASREIGTVVPVLDDGSGPIEYGCEVLYVRARSRQRAKVLALRAWRRRRPQSWRRYGWIDDGCNPFSGMKVFVAGNDLGEEREPAPDRREP